MRSRSENEIRRIDVNAIFQFLKKILSTKGKFDRNVDHANSSKCYITSKYLGNLSQKKSSVSAGKIVPCLPNRYMSAVCVCAFNHAWYKIQHNYK